MARIEPDTRTGDPRCSGCGAVLQVRVSHWLIDSRVRGGPYGADAARRGSCAREVAAFAQAHRACLEPARTVTAAGVAVTDRRRWR